MEPITIEEMMILPRRHFVGRMGAWIKMFNGGNLLELDSPLHCPLHRWVVHNDKKCNKELVANTATCPLCGNPCCPDCQNHKVETISRVTGYLSVVSGWNEAKKQEYRDRDHYELEGR